MKISELILPEGVTVSGDVDREVTGINHDSRVTQPGDIYAALPGANVHGARFVRDLAERGIAAVLTDDDGRQIIAEAGADAALTLLLVEDPRSVLGGLAAQIYATDAESPRLYGVTGTNGKTTTTFILDALLQALGLRTGLIGTVSTVIAGERVDSVRTTPEAPELHQFFARMRGADVTDCCMEVSSHALIQHRVDGAAFAVAGFTNLTQDHLDFHHSMDEYYRAKALLFTREFSQRGVVVLADAWARRLAAESEIPISTLSADPADEPTYLIGRTDGSHTLSWSGAGDSGPQAFRDVQIAFTAPLPGSFNVTNTALALAMLLEGGANPTDLQRAANGLRVVVPGRMEVVQAARPRAIVDYSHTPDAISKVLSSLSGDPLVVVVGAGGDRDAAKRPLMGRSAVEGADIVIITDDNPRSEDPTAIRAAVEAGAREASGDGSARAAQIENIGDRRRAIERAVALAGDTGTVLVAGKGHETGQEAAGVRYHFDDREETRTAIDKLKPGT